MKFHRMYPLYRNDFAVDYEEGRVWKRSGDIDCDECGSVGAEGWQTAYAHPLSESSLAYMSGERGMCISWHTCCDECAQMEALEYSNQVNRWARQ